MFDAFKAEEITWGPPSSDLTRAHNDVIHDMKPSQVVTEPNSGGWRESFVDKVEFLPHPN